MCFSAQASFIAASGIGAIGILCLTKVRKKTLYPFALTPLIFALQQFNEGVVWLTYIKQNWLYTLSMHTYVLIALCFWPVWVPVSLYYAEPDPRRKAILQAFSILGIVFSCAGIMALVLHPQITSLILDHHQTYSIFNDPFPYLSPELARYAHDTAVFMYTILAIVPFFISGLTGAWIAGILNTVTYCIIQNAYIIQAFASIWCFSAAVASLLCYYIIMVNNAQR